MGAMPCVWGWVPGSDTRGEACICTIHKRYPYLHYVNHPQSSGGTALYDFDKQPQCCKCLSYDVKLSLCTSGNANAEWLDVRCQRCGHVWEMRCADYKPEPTTKDEDRYII